MEGREQPSDGRDITNIARSLVTLISQQVASPNIGARSGQGFSHSGNAESSGPRVPTVANEMQRSFPGFFQRGFGRGRKRPIPKNVPLRHLRLTVCLLPRPTDVTPKPSNEMELLTAGLGKRTICIPENATHIEIQKILEEQFSKIHNVTGGWLIYKATGGCGQRKLCVVPTESEGYSAPQLKSVSVNGRNVLYIVPLQDHLSCAPLPCNSPEFAKMPKATCKVCDMEMPLQFLALHVKSCTEEHEVSEPNDESNKIFDLTADEPSTDQCPICGKIFERDVLALHASTCSERMFPDELPCVAEEDPMEGTSSSTTASTNSAPKVVEDEDWKTDTEPGRAVEAFMKQLKEDQEHERLITFRADLRLEPAERERSIIAFYKTQRAKWASPLQCILEGDPAIGEGVNRHFLSLAMHGLQQGFHINYGNGPVTRLFEGGKDHKIPCASQQLLDSDLFVMAGRILGHSFIHGGPGLAGVSPAIIHVLLGGAQEMCVVTLDDCPDVDQRNVIRSLEEEEMSQEQRKAVTDLIEMWELPRLTSENRLYIYQCLLQRAVLGRTIQQVKQLRKGLKETGVWPLLSERRDVAIRLFPREDEHICSSEVILNSIIWPKSVDEDDDEEFELETKCRIMGYLRRFITASCPNTIKDLMKFWTGWEVPGEELKVEVVQRRFPTSLTCFQTLRLPGHVASYEEFESVLTCCIQANDTGFGLV